MVGGKWPKIKVDTLEKGADIKAVIPLHSPPGRLIARHAAEPCLHALMREFPPDPELHRKIIELTAAEAKRLSKSIGADYFIGGWGRQFVYCEASQSPPNVIFGVVGNDDVCLVKYLPHTFSEFLVVVGLGRREIWKRVTPNLFLSKPLIRKRKQVPWLLKFDYVLFVL